MKGVILAGGTGSRLKPCTEVTNKHLLPVYDKPMIYFPIQTLIHAGIKDILIVTGTDHAGAFMQLLGSGQKLGAHFTFKVQDGPSGIAQALSCAEDFAQGDSIAVILGDNIYQENFKDAFASFRTGATIFVKEVRDPYRFGVVELSGSKVLSIEEKPENPKSNFAQTGLYLYDKNVFDIIRTLQPSRRGEYEITDVNNAYLQKGALQAIHMKGDWSDAGTHESLFRASKIARSLAKVQDEEIFTELPKVTVGVLLYKSLKYLPLFIASLERQDYKNLEIILQDATNGESEDKAWLAKNYPDIRVIGAPNLGFAAGHNNIIRNSDGVFYLALNPDMILEPDFISELIQSFSRDKTLGSATGKIKRWDFGHASGPESGKTNFIDTVGIRFLKSHRFEDIGQGEVDQGQFNEEKEIFGASGAAALYRRSALEEVAYTRENGTKEYFDELMFMYKEDIDLAYRLRWAGFGCLYVPTALAYHDRTVDKKAVGRDWLTIIRNRKHRPRAVKEWSYLNHQIMLEKNRDPSFSFDTKQKTWSYGFQSLGFILLQEPFLLQQRKKLQSLMPEIEKRKSQITKRIQPAEMEKWME